MGLCSTTSSSPLFLLELDRCSLQVQSRADLAKEKHILQDLLAVEELALASDRLLPVLA